MNIKEKFTAILANIENQSKDENISSKEIVEYLARSEGKSIRDISLIFDFFADRSLSEYIKERKLMEAYHYMIHDKKPIISNAVQISGLGDQSSFSKKVSKKFGKSPTEVIKEKNTALYEDPMTWEDIASIECSENYVKKVVEQIQMEKNINSGSENHSNISSKIESAAKQEKTVFGIPMSLLERYNKIKDLQAFYNFSDLMCETALKFSEEYKQSLNNVFEYIQLILYETLEMYDSETGEFIGQNESLNNIIFSTEEDFIYKWLWDEMTTPEYMYLYFDLNHSNFYEIFDKAFTNENITGNIFDFDCRLIKLMAIEEMSLSECREALEFYNKYKYNDSDIKFNKFVEILENDEFCNDYEYAFYVTFFNELSNDYLIHIKDIRMFYRDRRIDYDALNYIPDGYIDFSNPKERKFGEKPKRNNQIDINEYTFLEENEDDLDCFFSFSAFDEIQNYEMWLDEGNNDFEILLSLK